MLQHLFYSRLHFIRNNYLTIQLVFALCFLQNISSHVDCVVLQGGIYVLQVMDWYSSTFSLMIIAFSECLIIGWLYGIKFCFLQTHSYFVFALNKSCHRCQHYRFHA